jgi:tannase
LLLASSAAVAYATSLADVCSKTYVTSALPPDSSFNGITINALSVTANLVYNETHTGGTFFPDSTINYCNVTFTYTHNGLGDTVILGYYMPAPSAYKNRFLATGGGAYAIQSGSQSAPGGVMYGAASGYTDGSFGGFDVDFDDVFLLANGTVNWPIVYMFGYQAIKEMTVIGKKFTSNFYGSNNTKIYTYYQGCSEGGREGWSQAQRAGEEYDGIITGAPALRYGQQQVNHLFSNVVEQTLNYYPSTCELDKIVNETIAACDPLDGKTDGVVSRSDLCQLQFNMSSIIGKSYYCAAETSSSLGLGFGKRQSTSTTPAQNGSVTAEAITVVQAITNGLHDSDGRRVYLGYQMGAGFNDAETSYNSETNTWELVSKLFQSSLLNRI